MIRLEVVLKDSWGRHMAGSASERVLKREIVETITERVEADSLEIVRIQFLPAPPKKKRVRRAAS